MRGQSCFVPLIEASVSRAKEHKGQGEQNKGATHHVFRNASISHIWRYRRIRFAVETHTSRDCWYRGSRNALPRNGRWRMIILCAEEIRYDILCHSSHAGGFAGRGFGLPVFSSNCIYEGASARRERISASIWRMSVYEMVRDEWRPSKSLWTWIAS